MLAEHIDYLSDARRTEYFRRAIAVAVQGGETIADLGCGSGILGLFCLQNGARRVHFIDHSSAIELARETITRAGFADRATFMKGATQRIDLPEKVDLLICDHVGYFGFDYGIFSLLRDARDRFLKPGSRLVPSQLEMKFAPFGSKSVWERVARWQSAAVPSEFHWVHGAAVNVKHPANLQGDDLLAEPAQLARVDFLGEIPAVLKATTRFRVARDGELHGIAGFFSCQLLGDVWMTNAPGANGAIDRPQAILPLPEPVPVKKDETIEATIMARPWDDLIAWEVCVQEREFRQSTFNGSLMNAQELHRLAPTHRPRMKHDAQSKLLVLGYCDGIRSNSEIAEAVLADQPQLMPSEDEIRNFVTSVLKNETE